MVPFPEPEFRPAWVVKSGIGVMRNADSNTGIVVRRHHRVRCRTGVPESRRSCNRDKRGIVAGLVNPGVRAVLTSATPSAVDRPEPE